MPRKKQSDKAPGVFTDESANALRKYGEKLAKENQERVARKRRRAGDKKGSP
ncbi:MAG: hypothetical protein L0H73_05895 [Nitrococcus sp.]|nr:hypothetical protein [Nitrococcus sp.]